MGKEFGNLQKLWGINYYVLSPYELKPFAGFLNPGLANTLRRFREHAPQVLLTFVSLFTLIEVCNSENRRLNRKNPLDYECDV